MRASGREVPPAESGVCTAHEVFKGRSRSWPWIGLIISVGAHFLLFAVVWRWQPAERTWNVPAAAMQALEVVDVVEVAVVPPRVTAPAPPVVPPIDPPEDVVMTPVVLGEEYVAPPEIPAPPQIPVSPVPADVEEELASYEHFMPYMVKPELVNRGEVRRALEREYPWSLQRSGIGGAVVVWFWIDETGKVQKYEIRQSSGIEGLDRAAERVIPRMKFQPAMKQGEPIRVIVALPIRFESR